MCFLVYGGASPNVVDRLEPGDFVVSGCRSVRGCRLLAVLQQKKLKQIIDRLAACYDADLSPVLSLVPRLVSSSHWSPLAAIEFWQDVKSFDRSVSSFSLSFVRRLLNGTPSVLDPGRLNRPGNRDVHSLLFSFSLFGKSLNAPCSCFGSTSYSAGHREGISRVDPFDPCFLGFAADCTSKLFYKGWDKKYFSFLASSVVTAKATQELPYKSYGALGAWSSQFDYIEDVLHGSLKPTARYSEVLSAGKIRPLTVPHSSYQILRPLHKTLYDFLSSCPWLLRGAPSASRFDFSSPGDFISVDFSSATDNLSVNCAEAILGAALKNSRFVSPTLKDAALSSLRPRVSYPCGTDVELSMGQMMGSLLSFPLLCLQTFFFHLWCSNETSLSGRELRSYSECLINGDDLVFKGESKNFFSEAAKTLSVVNEKKTGVSASYFNINSTLFHRGRDGVSSVPFIRPNQLYRDTAGDAGTCVWELTRWLRPGSKLLARTFGVAMSFLSKLVVKSGRSFFLAGFFGDKQSGWLKHRGFLNYESEVRRSREESDFSSSPSSLSEKMVPLPSSFKKIPSTVLSTLTSCYSAYIRFHKDISLSRRVEPLVTQEKKSRFDLDEDQSWRECRLFGLGEKMLRVKPKLPSFSDWPSWKLPLQSVPVVRRRYPLVHATSSSQFVFWNKKEKKAFFYRELKRTKDPGGELVPEGLVLGLTTRLLGGSAFHPVVLDEIARSVKRSRCVLDFSVVFVSAGVASR